MCNAERYLSSGGSLNVCKVYKYALCGFGSEINLVFAVLCYALKCLEHKVELTNVGKVMFAAVWAWDIVFVDVVCHLLICPTCNIGTVKVLYKLVGSVTGFAFATVHKRVGKAAEMSRSNPSLRIHKNCGIKTYIVFVFLNEFLSPGVLDICFKFNAERTVIPCICKSAVNFASRIYKASAFAKGNDLVE